MRALLLLPLPLALVACGYDEATSGAFPASFGAPAPAMGDRFTAVGTNPFVDVAHDPFSTFAIDVDTASYDIFRRDVERGGLPQAASVRVEEYVNSFAYDYPTPAAGAAVPFAIDLGASAAITSTRTSIVRIGIQGRAPHPQQRLAANLVFLIDTSGSMQGEEKLGLVQAVLRSAVGSLQSGDTVSIVTYAGSVGVALAPTDDRDDMLDAIDDFEAGGGTAGGQGIQLAYDQARAAFIQGGFNHVLLCTDGDFNVGPSSDEELVDLIKAQRASGITLTVLGFGAGNLNDSMMEKVSNAGNGFYSVISSVSQAQRYGSTHLFQTVELIARDVKVQVEMNPAHVEAYRLLGYENRMLLDHEFADDRVDGGEIGAGHRVTALYEIVRAGEAVPTNQQAPDRVTGAAVTGPRTVGAGEALVVRVRYKAPGAGDGDAASEVSTTLAPAALAAGSAGDPDTTFAVALAAFAEILKGSPYAEPSKLDAIQAVLDAQASRDADRAELAALVRQARVLMGR